MSWLDIVLLVVIANPTLLGFRAGIIKAVLSLAGVIVGVILAGRYYVLLSEQLTFITHAGAAKIVGFAIILIVVMIIAGVAASLLKWAASVVLLGWVNRLGGALFGLVLGAILCGAFLATWINFLGIGGAIADSALARVLLDYFPVVLALLPDEFDAVRSFFQ